MSSQGVLGVFFSDMEAIGRSIEQAVNDFKSAYTRGAQLTNFIIEKKDEMIGKASETAANYVNSVFSGFENSIKGMFKDFYEQFEKSCNPRPNANQKCSEPAPASSYKAPDNVTLDDMVDDVAGKGTHQPGSSVDSVVESYSCTKPHLENKSHASPVLLERFAYKVTDMYNMGYNTRELKRELRKEGYEGIRNYDDVASHVAFCLGKGEKYYRNDSYNYRIAEKIGANEKLIADYAAGKSCSEVMANFRRATGGMNISYSSLRRIVKRYEQEKGKDVIKPRIRAKRANVKRRIA